LNIRSSETRILGVKIINIPFVADERGFFYEVYRNSIWESAAIPVPLEIKQISQSRSKAGVVRGLHYQISPPMIKVIRCLQGHAKLIAVDPRKNSPSFGNSVVLDSVDCSSLFLYCPAGIAVGFAAYTTPTVIEYLCSAEYNPNGQNEIAYNDPTFNINWDIEKPLLSERDANAPRLTFPVDFS